MQMVRVWVRPSKLGVCKVSTGVCHNGEMQGWFSLSLSILKLTAAQKVLYVHSLTVFVNFYAVNFYATSAMKH